MAIAEMPSLRVERAESARLIWALALSLCLHLLIYGGYQTGKKLGWWEHLHWPAWMQSPNLLPAWLKKKERPEELQKLLAQQQAREVPLIFVQVSPAEATPDPPPNAKYYSALNSHAANPEADKETDTPKITGKRPEIVRTKDVPRQISVPLQPTPPAPPPTPKAEPKPQEPKPQEQESQEELKPKPAYTPGELAAAKPDPKPRQETDTGDAPQPKLPRPRTVAEAKARLPNSDLSGEKMKQDGGVRRHNIESSLDARGTPFGAYDDLIVRAVQNRWYMLLDSRGWAADRTGKVSLRFHLNADGTVTEMQFIQNTVDLALGMLCQSAITDSAPFPPWPGDMRRAIGGSFRDVTFTFYYY